MTYRIITDASTDINLDFIKKTDLIVIPMETTMEGEVVPIEATETEKLNRYYELMIEDKPVASSQVNLSDFEKYFSKCLDQGQDIIYAGLSEGLSGTYANAVEAGEKLRKKYPERKITIINSLSASTGNGVLIQYAQELKDQGTDYDDLVELMKESLPFLTAQFGVDDLKYLYKGGRVSKTTAGVGNLLKVKPMIHIDEEGKLEVTSLNRGKKNNMKKLLKNFKTSWMPDLSDLVVIGYAYYEENAEMLKAMVEEEVPEARVYTAPIGSLIGTHVGPGMYSLCYFGKRK